MDLDLASIFRKLASSNFLISLDIQVLRTQNGFDRSLNAGCVLNFA